MAERRKIDKLTPLQRAFVLAYTGEHKGNGVASARAAGYSGDEIALAASASRSLCSAKVIAAIREITDEDDAKVVISKKRALAYLASVINDKAEKTNDRIKASELLIRARGGFIDRKKVEVKDKRKSKLNPDEELARSLQILDEWKKKGGEQ